ncbi:MAG: LiaF transmembrane domain-containing protein [Candidatus Eiseniibacteriota bacterium]
MSETTNHSAFRLVFGLGLVAAGILFTLANLGLIDSDVLSQYWPTLIILYGLLRMIGVGCQRSWLTGLMIALFGAWWLLHNLGLLPFDIWQMWPLLLIFVGLGIMRRGYWGRYIAGIGYIGVSSRRRRAARFGSAAIPEAEVSSGGSAAPATPGASESEGSAPGGYSDPVLRREAQHRAARHAEEHPWRGFAWVGTGAQGTDTHGMVRVDVFMSSISRKVASQEFRGGEVVAVLGGAELDLRSAKIAEGSARLEVNLIMGGLTLFVPEDWVVEFQGTPIMGGIDDQTRRPAGEIRGRLMITGVVLLSGILIKN